MSATATSARRAAPGRAAPARPARRVSGPVEGRTRARTAPRPVPRVGARALAVVRSLPHHSIVDRLVRGRAWIPVLGVLLAGLVTMQVEMLKLGTSLGRSLERTTALQSENETLQARVATLADAQRIERLATGMGMVMPSPGLLTFLSAHPQHQIGRAISNVSAPNPVNFAAQLSAAIAQATLVAPATTTLPGAGTSSTSASTAGTGSTANATAPAGSTIGATATGSTATATGSNAAVSTGSTAASTGTSPGTPTASGAGSAGGASASGPSTGATSTAGNAPSPAGGAALPSTSASGTGNPTGG